MDNVVLSYIVIRFVIEFLWTFFEVFFILNCYSVLVFLVEVVNQKLRFKYKNLVLILLVIAAYFSVAYQSSYTFSDIFAAKYFGYRYSSRHKELAVEYWYKIFAYPFNPNTCYTPVKEQCRSWDEFLKDVKGIDINFQRIVGYGYVTLYGVNFTGFTFLMSMAEARVIIWIFRRIAKPRKKAPNTSTMQNA